MFLFCLIACSDPPTPPPIPGPADLPRWSTAPHVAWEGLQQTRAPHQAIALFVDAPGGPLDQLAHDADVATFLNDRFHAVFLTPERAGLQSGVRFLSAEGCLIGAAQPPTPAAWIAAANDALLSTQRRTWPGIGGLAADHPLSGGCGTIDVGGTGVSTSPID